MAPIAMAWEGRAQKAGLWNDSKKLFCRHYMQMQVIVGRETHESSHLLND
jgi:hypothetical protein